MDILHTLGATSLVRIFSFFHGPGEHRDPDEERFDHPELMFTLADRWGLRCGRGEAIGHPGMVILGNQEECYRCRHFTPVPHDRTVGVSFVGLSGPSGGPFSEWLGPFRQQLFTTLAVPLTREFRWSLRQLFREITIRPPGFHLKIDDICSSLLVDVVRFQRVHTRSAGRAPVSRRRPLEAVARAREHIEKHFTENIELLTLADVAGVSPFHLSRLFKEAWGYSPHQYLLRTRLDHAATLLRDTRAPILDVALGVGFQDATHFARLFRRHTGLTPTAYRHSKPQD
jgi:AraC-like DNA-binding protein